VNKFNLVIFDIDGTLVNSYPAIISSANHTLGKFGLKKQSKEVIKKAVGWGDVELLKPFIGDEDMNKVIRAYRKHHKKSLLRESSLMPYAAKLLSYLHKKDYKLAVASNRPSKFSYILLKHLHIKKYFDYILCKDELRFGKPHPSILNKIMNRLNGSNDNTLYVGDMAIDVETAKRARVTSFAVATGSSSYDELKKEHPDFLERSLKRLFNIL